MKFPIAVKGTIRKSDKILIVRRKDTDEYNPGIWETPGGGMETENTPEDELKREIREETGLEIKVREPFRIFTFKNTKGEYKVGISYLCDYVSGEVNLSEEHVEYRWIKAEEFENYNSIPILKKEIKDYAKGKK
jgi:8-oxo-dGTP diphosphatase